MVPIHYLAVLLSAVASMIIGFVWYGPLFGKMWMTLSGMTQEQIEQAKKSGMSSSYFIAFLGSLLMSYVLAHALIFASTYLQVQGIQAGLTAGFWNWLGFIMPVTLGSVLWEKKPWKLWIINNGYHLITLLVMGAILAIW